MIKSVLLAVAYTFLLASCSSAKNSCEDVTLASEQIQACQALQKRIVSAKNDVLIRSELERRYQQDCIDIRFYRDEKQAAICGNKHKVKEIRKSIMAETE